MSMHESFQAAPTTIGRLLAGDPLAVPRFQREYSWTEDEVDKLLRDFSKAKRQQPQPQAYFLGSVVLASANPAEVIDGQQRLATCTILLAVIRDLLIELKREHQAESIDTQYLNYRAFQDGGVSARLTLNVDDRAFFWQAIEHHHHSIVGIRPSRRLVGCFCHAENRSGGAVESRRAAAGPVLRNTAPKSITQSDIGRLAKRHHDPGIRARFFARFAMSLWGE
jgi:hypothetical protein